MAEADQVDPVDPEVVRADRDAVVRVDRDAVVQADRRDVVDRRDVADREVVGADPDVVVRAVVVTLVTASGAKIPSSWNRPFT